MFRDRFLNWTKIFDPFTFTIGALLVHVKTMRVDVKTSFGSFGRRWDSNTHEREFERELLARRAFNELQSRLPTAR